MFVLIVVSAAGQAEVRHREGAGGQPAAAITFGGYPSSSGQGNPAECRDPGQTDAQCRGMAARWPLQGNAR